MSKFHLPSYGSELGFLRDATMIAKKLGMFYLAQTFLIIAIIASVLGFGGILGLRHFALRK
jgi:hypothetical protein